MGHARVLDITSQRETMHPGPGASEEHCEGNEENDDDHNDGGLAGEPAHWLRPALHAVDSTPWDDEAAERPTVTALEIGAA